MYLQPPGASKKQSAHLCDSQQFAEDVKKVTLIVEAAE